MESHQNTSEIDFNTINYQEEAHKNLPFPIAVLYKQMQGQSAQGEKLASILETYDRILMYLSLLLCAQAKEQDIPLPPLNESLPDWFALLNKMMNLSAQEVPLVSHIKGWYSQIEGKNLVYSEEIENYQRIRQEIGHLRILRKLQEMSLRTLHVLNEEEVAQVVTVANNSLNHLIQDLTFLQAYPLCWVEKEENGQFVIHQLLGESRNFSQSTVEAPNENLRPGRVYLYNNEEKSFLSLHPFIIYQDCYFSIKNELPEVKDVFLLQNHTQKRLCYSGSIYNIGLREHFEYYRQILERQQAPASLENSLIKQIWEKSFHFTEKTLDHLRRSNLMGNYFPRKEGEYLLENFINQSRFPLFLVSGARGTGKTTLLAQMAKRWSARGEFVLFLRHFGDTIEDLKEFFAQILGNSQFLDEIKDNDQEIPRFIIIFDAIDNSPQPQTMLQSVANFAKMYPNQVRIILSLSSLWCQRLTEHFPNELLFPCDGSCPLLETQQMYYQLGDISPALTKEFYLTLRRKYSGPVAEYESFPKTVRSMLEKPALARLFFMSVRSREINRSLGLRDLMEGVVVSKINSSKQKREIMEQTIRVLQQRKKSALSLDEVITTDEPVLMKSVLNFCGHSEFMSLMCEGIIERTEYYNQEGKDLVVHLPYSLLREYLCYRTLALTGKHSDEFLPSYCEEMENNHNPTLYGGVFFALIRLIDKHYFDRLGQVIQKVPNLNLPLRQILVDILIFKEKTSSPATTNKLVSALLSSATENSLLALGDFAVYLYKSEKYTLASFLFENLAEHFKEQKENYSQLSFYLLAAICYQQISDNRQAIKLYKKSYKGIKKVDNPSYAIQFYFALAQAYNDFQEPEKALHFLKKCQELASENSDSSLQPLLLQAQGLAYELEENLSAALESYQKQYQLLKEMQKEHLHGRVLENLARLYQKRGENKEAANSLKKAISVHGKWQDVLAQAQCQKELAGVLESLGEKDDIVSLLDAAKETFESLNHKVPLAEVYMRLGSFSQGVEKPQVCREYFAKAIKLFEEMQEHTKLGECYAQMGHLEHQMRKHKGAIENYQHAIEIYKGINHARGIADICFRLGDLYNAQAEYNQAYENYAEAIKLYKQLQDYNKMAEGHSKISVILAQSGKFSAAEEKLQISQQLYEKVEDSRGIAIVKSTRGFLYKLQNNRVQALENYLEAAEMFEKLEEKRLLASVYNNIGLIYKEKGDNYESLIYFEKSAELYQQTNNPYGLAAAYNNIGMIYDAKGDYEQALKYYNMDLELTKKIGDKKGLATSYNNLALLYYNHQNYPRALWALEKSLALYEELGNTSTAQKVRERIQHVREKI